MNDIDRERILEEVLNHPWTVECINDTMQYNVLCMVDGISIVVVADIPLELADHIMYTHNKTL